MNEEWKDIEWYEGLYLITFKAVRKKEKPVGKVNVNKIIILSCFLISIMKKTKRERGLSNVLKS